MSRKSPTFNQLFDYMEKGSRDRAFILTHNLKLARGTARETILEQFYDNASLLRRSEKQNYLYHEVLSLKLTKNIEETRLKRIMFELGKMYLQERAKENLAYGRIHIEPSQDMSFTNVHVHLMISSNGLESTKRHRLEKQQFHTIQKQLETYVLERYPELAQHRVYDKDYKKIRVNNLEYQLKQRTGKKTQREQVKELLSFIFAQVQSQEELLQYCAKYKVKFYQRGKYSGIEIEGRKYRLQKLELETEYQNLWKRLQKLEELNRIKSEVEREPVPHQREEQPEQPKKQPVYESDFVKERMEDLKKAHNQAEPQQEKAKEKEPENVPEHIRKRLQELQQMREQQHEQELERD